MRRSVWTVFLWLLVALVFGIKRYLQPVGRPFHGATYTLIFLPERFCRIPPDVEGVLRNACCSLDLALYNLDFKPLEDLLLEKAEAGVRIRVVTDGRRRNGRAFRRLARHGIPVVYRPKGGLMHNKFIVVDDEVVITGSANWTRDGLCEQANHIVLVRHQGVARAYAQEFEEMFSRKIFGNRGKEPPVRFGDTLEVWFSPDMDIPDLLVSRIRRTRDTVQVLALTLTDDRIARALRDARKRGVFVEVLAEKDEPSGSDLGRLARVLPVCRDRDSRLFHHKAMRLDHWLLLGSYNFSRSAATRNDENLLWIKASPELLEVWNQNVQILKKQMTCTSRTL